jgi:hypothetical protein
MRFRMDNFLDSKWRPSLLQPTIYVADSAFSTGKKGTQEQGSSTLVFLGEPSAQPVGLSIGLNAGPLLNTVPFISMGWGLWWVKRWTEQGGADMMSGCTMRKSIVCNSNFVNKCFLKSCFQCIGLEVTLGL